MQYLFCNETKSVCVCLLPCWLADDLFSSLSVAVVVVVAVVMGGINASLLVSLAVGIAVLAVLLRPKDDGDSPADGSVGSRSSSSSSFVAPWPVINGTWNTSDPHFISRMVRQRVPVVFRRDLLDYPHPATRWGPLRKWNPYSMWTKSLKERTMLPNVRVSRGIGDDDNGGGGGLAGHVFTLATNRSGDLMTWAAPSADELSYTDNNDMPMHKMLDECCGFKLDRDTSPEDCAAATTADPPRTRHL